MSNVNFFVDDSIFSNNSDNNNIINYNEMDIDIDSQLAAVLTEEEYTNYINNKFNEHGNVMDDTIDIDIEQLMLFYNEYNVKSLTQLLQYYGIYKPKMIKNEMIQLLVLFETQKENVSVVTKRIRLWRNIEELKSDHFFGKYIMF